MPNNYRPVFSDLYTDTYGELDEHCFRIAVNLLGWPDSPEDWHLMGSLPTKLEKIAAGLYLKRRYDGRVAAALTDLKESGQFHFYKQETK